MKISDLELHKKELSYDKILKKTLAQSKDVTIRFFNGLFHDNIPLDAPVEFLDRAV